jgi:hypothetical protein
MNFIAKLQKLPWTPVLLLALLVVCWQNWRATVHLEVRQHEQLNILHDSIERVAMGHNQILIDMNKDLDSIEFNTDCLKHIRPIACR